MRYTLFAIAGCLAMVSTGCGGARHEATEKYVLVATNVKLPYWQSANSGLLRAARQLGVQAEMVGPETYDVMGEKQAFANALTKKPAGIMVSVSDAKALQGDINTAIAQGIPVITMDSDAPDSKRLSFIGTDNYQAGQTGGRILAKSVGGKGSIVVFTMPGQTNLNQRLQGYRTILESTSGMKITQVVDIKGDPRIAFDTANEIVTKSAASVDAFVCLEASACKEVAEVVSRNKVSGKVIIAMDTDKETLEAIQKGTIAATIGQKPFTMAFYGLKMLDDLHHHPPETLDRKWSQDSFAPLPVFVDTGATLIDKSNVEEFLRSREAAHQK